jgi:branched-chain amino acid transport system permease protein
MAGLAAALGQLSAPHRATRALAWAASGLLLLGVLALVIGADGLVAATVVGLQFGAVYALIALGIALVYKATRVLNFAQGVFGSVPAFVAYTIMIGAANIDNISAPVDAGRLWWASLVAIAVGAILAVLVNGLVVRRLASASAVTSLVATAGVMLMFIAGELILFQAQVRPFPRYVPGAPCVGSQGGQCVPLQLGGVTVSWHTLVVLTVLGVAAALLGLFFRTPPGVALLATSQEPFAAELQGVSAARMSTLAWGMAGTLAAVGGLLGAGVYEQITPGIITTTFLIPAFIAAVLGGITSMVGAVVGGLVLGFVFHLANQVNLALDLGLNGAPQLAQFAILLLVLAVRPRGLLGKEA